MEVDVYLKCLLSYTDKKCWLASVECHHFSDTSNDDAYNGLKHMQRGVEGIVRKTCWPT